MNAFSWNQKDIANSIEKANPNFAWLLRECEADIVILQPSFIHMNSILRIEIDSTSHPVLFFVAMLPDGTYKLLTGYPEAFNEIITTEKLNLDESQAIELSDLFVEVTQDRQTPLFALNTVVDIPYFGELSAEQIEKKHREQAKYKELIKPPIVEMKGSSFHIKRFFLDGKELQRWTITTLTEGTVRSTFETVGSDVGLYYWI